MKPLCDLCNTRHESYQAHIWPKTVATLSTAVVVNDKELVVNVVVNARGKDRHKNKEARREYLRLKMREHRAKKRAGSPQ
jgi:hypothetical protein